MSSLDRTKSTLGFFHVLVSASDAMSAAGDIAADSNPSTLTVPTAPFSEVTIAEESSSQAALSSATPEAAGEGQPVKKKQKRNKPTLSCEECVERKTKVRSRCRCGAPNGPESCNDH